MSDDKPKRTGRTKTLDPRPGYEVGDDVTNPRVFCKGCRWFKEIFFDNNALGDGAEILFAQRCVPIPFLNPITGEPFNDSSYREPSVVNVNYDCSMYEAKEGGE